MRLKILLGIMVIGAAGALITAYTGAVFTDQATSNTNTFTAGTLDMKLNVDGTGVVDSQDAIWTLGAMAPGDAAVHKIVVSDAGSLQMRYALSLAAPTTAFNISGYTPASPSVVTLASSLPISTGNVKVTITGSDNSGAIDGTWLAKVDSATTVEIPVVSAPSTGAAGGTLTLVSLDNALAIQIVADGSACTPATTTDTNTTFVTQASGGRWLVGDTGSGGGTYQTIGSLSSGKLFGDLSTHAGETVDANSTETLCVKVALPIGTPGTPSGMPNGTPTTGYQGATSILNFQFNAEQTAHNP